MPKHRVTFTDEELWHIFITFDMIMGSCSESETDCRVTIRLAQILHRLGYSSGAVDLWRRRTVEDWEDGEAPSLELSLEHE